MNASRPLAVNVDPTNIWTIKESESASWGKVKLSSNGPEFYEKEIIPFSDN